MDDSERYILVEKIGHAQTALRADIGAMIRELQQFADAATRALGEISVDEAWTGVRAICIEHMNRHGQYCRHCGRESTRTSTRRKRLIRHELKAIDSVNWAW